MSEHTKTPWVVDRDYRPGMSWNNHIVSEVEPNMTICFMSHDGTEANAKGEANAALIVTAVNAYEPDQARIAELQAEVARLEDQLDEARHAPWPQWADDIRKKLEEYGVDVGPENEWDIGEQFENWIDGAVEDALRQHSAALEKRHD